MPQIETLIEDIQRLLTEGKKDTNPVREQSSVRATDFGKRLAELLLSRLYGPARVPGLTLSQLGVPDRKLWYQVNQSRVAEPLDASAILKFLYGDILEELLLFLAEEAGHDVQGRQDTIAVHGVKGHRDAVIDGRLVDVKSASSYSFQKFKDGRLAEDDPFGYRTQLDSYLAGSADDPVVTEKELASFLVVDKTLGHLCLDTHTKQEVDYSAVVSHKKTMLANSSPPEEKCYRPVPEGKSGNEKLSVGCSYCPFKKECWPGLRTFIYSSGPVYLTKVIREPKVYEVAVASDT